MLKIAKTNFVVMKLLMGGHKKDDKVGDTLCFVRPGIMFSIVDVLHKGPVTLHHRTNTE